MQLGLLRYHSVPLQLILLSFSFVPLRFENVTLSSREDPMSLDVAWRIFVAGLLVGTPILGLCKHGATHCQTKHQPSSFSYVSGFRTRGTLLHATLPVLDETSTTVWHYIIATSVNVCTPPNCSTWISQCCNRQASKRGIQGMLPRIHDTMRGSGSATLLVLVFPTNTREKLGCYHQITSV
jgi:hypothetical protein